MRVGAPGKQLALIFFHYGKLVGVIKNIKTITYYIEHSTKYCTKNSFKFSIEIRLNYNYYSFKTDLNNQMH